MFFRKNNRLNKLLIALLMFTLIFPLNSVFAKATSIHVFLDPDSSAVSAVTVYASEKAIKLGKSGGKWAGGDGGEYVSNQITKVVVVYNGVTQEYSGDQLNFGKEAEGTVKISIKLDPTGSIQINKTYSPALEAEESPAAVFDLHKEKDKKPGEKIGSITITGEDSDSFLKLKPGNYYLKETAPSGYTLSIEGLTPNKGYYKISVGTSAVILSAVNTKNDTPPADTGSITINKAYSPALGEEETAPIATFQLFTKEGDAYTQTGSDLEITGASSGTFPNLEFGTYYLKELPLDGYTLSITDETATDGYYEIVVDSTTAVVLAALNTKNNTPPPVLGSIKVIKSYAYPEQPSFMQVQVIDLPEATFNLYSDAEGKTLVASTKIDGEGSAVFGNLTLGTYWLGEEGLDNYTSSLDGLQEVVVTSAHATAPLEVEVTNTFTEDLYSIDISKSYSDMQAVRVNDFGIQALPSAVFNLYDSDKNFLQSGTVEGYWGNVELHGLKAGTYYIKEISPPGYVGFIGEDRVDDYYQIEVPYEGEHESIGMDGNTLYISVENVPVPTGIIEITKLNQRGLAWDRDKVEFIVYTKDSETNRYNKVVSGYTSTENDDTKGKLVFEGLDLSKTYYLSEVIPSGYRSSLAAYTLVKFNDDNIASIEVTNTRRSTGGGGDPEPITPTPEEPVTTPPEEPVVVPEEPEVFAPPTQELPKTGGNTAAYLFSGSALAGLGVLLRRFKR